MWKILSLPQKYKINKLWRLDSFLSKANLTEKELDELVLLVQKVELKYDVLFNDKSEMIFIDVNIKYQKNKWAAKGIAKTVAKAIPYQCIIYVHDNSTGYLSAFIRRENMNDIRRSTIIKQSVVPGFPIGNIPNEIEECLTDIRRIVTNENSSASLASRRCIKRIEECKEKCVRDWISTDESERIMYLLESGYEGICVANKIERAEDMWNSDICDSDEESCDDDPDYYEIFEEPEMIVQMSEEALCKSAYMFFCREGCYDDDCELEWLFDYAVNCIGILAELYSIEPEDGFYYKLGASFCEKDIDAGHGYEDDSAVQIMKEIREEDF